MDNKRQRRREGRLRRRVPRHRRSVLVVSTVVFLLIVSVKSLSLREKEAAYKAQKMELEAQIKEEKARAAEIEELGGYVGTDEYVEDVAREKLGLIHENEIVFQAE